MRPQRDDQRSRRLTAKTLGRRMPVVASVRERRDARLARLGEIARVLARGGDLERLLPVVADLVHREIPLHDVVLVVGTGDRARSFLWHAGDVSSRRMRIVRSHALRLSAYFAGESSWSAGDLASARRDSIPPRLRRAAARFAGSTDKLLTLPLAVEGGAVLGTLQVETVVRPSESDLAFVQQVAGLAGAALDRHEREAIARRGQARCRRDFPMSRSVRQLADLIRRHLG